MIGLRLLGPADATVDGGPPPPELLWKKHLALLVYLALAPDRRAGREQLTGLLWGDKPEASARHSLAEALRILRRCTDDGVEDVGAGYVRLADDAVEADTARFAGRMEAGDPRGAAALVAGEFMEGFALADAWEFEEWLARQRQTWRSRCEEALVAAAAMALAEGAPEAAHDFARRALALVPTSDTACQAAMRALCLGGDRGRALETYTRFATWLDDELGIAPAAETEELVERVRRQRRWRLPPGRAPGARRGAESRRAPLVGRGPEMAELVGQWERCRDDGSPRTVVVTGDSGTGRSRLLQEVADRSRLDGAAVAMVRALPADTASDGAVVEGVARAFGLDPSARGLDLADALGDAAGEAGLLVAVDDADWADDPSLGQLAAVGSRVRAPVMLVLATTRGPVRAAVDRLSADLGRDVPGALVRLDPLVRDALRELAAWAFPDYDDRALDRLTRRLEADTAGYPLLAVELLHALAHGFSPGEAAPAWPLTGRTLDQTRPGDLPDTLVAAVRVGFRVLTPEAQEALAVAAVLEPPVSPERFAAATGLHDPALEKALDELEWERWLAADDRGYAFVARLVQEIVARDMVTEGRRRRILGNA